jgi:hypothetical protein
MTVCSIIGTLLVIVGLYAFLWGKGKELQEAMAAAQNVSEKEDAGDTNEQGRQELETHRSSDEIA